MGEEKPSNSPCSRPQDGGTLDKHLPRWAVLLLKWADELEEKNPRASPARLAPPQGKRQPEGSI
jgi:hypothetical protein